MLNPKVTLSWSTEALCRGRDGVAVRHQEAKRPPARIP